MSERKNLIDTIAGIDMFSTFTRVMKTSNANEILSGEGQFTVFVPTNDAFGKLPDAQMNALLSENGQGRLKSLLSYHIVPAKLTADKLGREGKFKTISGQDINFTDRGGLKVNSSGLQARNIEATNGIIHGLDTVLTPPAITETATAAASVSASAASTLPKSQAETTVPAEKATSHLS